uniref:Protein regulator of cytokinesis 1 n=3 Tax=Ciona intestinalis TaxID=7719 RepID=F6VW31_CIOIN
MPRKSEVIQMDIQREFCSTMQELREIWDEIGIPDEQIETRGKTVLLHIRNLFQEMVSEEQNLKTNMMKKIETFLAEVDDLNEKMHLPPYTMPEGLNIMQKEKEIRMQANRLNKLKRERLCTLASLKSVEQELCDQLCTTPCYIPSTCIPSEEQLEQLVDHIETLKLEKVRRKEVFATKRTEIVDLFDELELRPETSFAQDLVTDEPDSFYLTSGKMDQLEDLRSELSIKKNEAQRLVEDLWQKVTCLWERLETPESERSNVRGECTGFKPHVVQRLQDVHTKLEHEKLIHLKSLTERCRSQIASLWDKCFYSADQRNQFIQAFDENYTVDLLD